MAYQPHVLSPKQQLKMCSAQGGRKEFFKFAPPKREKQLQPSWPLKRESKRASAGARAWAKDEGKRMRKATRESSCGFFLCALSFSHFSLSLSISLYLSLSLSLPFLSFAPSLHTHALSTFLCVHFIVWTKTPCSGECATHAAVAWKRVCVHARQLRCLGQHWHGAQGL